MQLIKIIFGIILLSSGGLFTEAEASDVSSKYHITIEDGKVILSPVTVIDAANITIIYDRGSNKPKTVVVGPKLIKADGQTTILGDGSVLM